MLTPMRAILIAAVLCSACAGNSPTSPTPAPTLPIVLSGQSNALPDYLGGPLRLAYPADVISVAQGGAPIRGWNADGPLWQALAPALRQSLAAFVWWQGEADALEGGEHYADDLRAFLARVRATNGTPSLRVVLVKILRYTPAAPLHDTSLVRDAEEAVATDPFCAIVRVDDLPSDGGTHLEDAAYPMVATRVVAAITAR